MLQDKSVKSVPVMSLDIIRMRENSIFVVSGHQKGQICLYEVRGVRADNFNEAQGGPMVA